MTDRPTGSFMDKYMRGEARPDDIDNYVDTWHLGMTKKPLHEFLGMTLTEYAEYVEKGRLPDRGKALTGKDVQTFLKALNLTPERFAKRAGMAPTKVRQVIRKYKNEEINDIKFLDAFYVAGLMSVTKRTEELKQQLVAIQGFELFFTELEQDLERRRKARKFIDRFGGDTDAEETSGD